MAPTSSKQTGSKGGGTCGCQAQARNSSVADAIVERCVRHVRLPNTCKSCSHTTGTVIRRREYMWKRSHVHRRGREGHVRRGTRRHPRTRFVNCFFLRRETKCESSEKSRKTSRPPTLTRKPNVNCRGRAARLCRSRVTRSLEIDRPDGCNTARANVEDVQ